MKQKRSTGQGRDIIHDIARRYGLSYTVVDRIVHSQFEAAKRHLEEARGDPYNAPNIIFQRLGRLAADTDRIPMLEMKRKKKEEYEAQRKRDIQRGNTEREDQDVEGKDEESGEEHNDK